MQRRYMFKISIYFTLLLFLVSCSETQPRTCYSFDEKQCRFDPWASSVSDTSKEESIIHYLSTVGVKVEEMYIDIAFHEVACLACAVCPSGPRIYIAVKEEDEQLLATLDLLNLTKTDCSNLP